MKRCKNSEDAFTLIEILMVLSIIAILAALITPRYFGQVSKSKMVAAKAEMKTLSLSLKAFRFDTDRYPATEEGLDALVKPPAGIDKKWRGPYLDTDSPDFDLKDPWDNPYVYICPGKHHQDGYDLISYGADGAEGGEDDDADIVNWKEEE